MSGSVVHDNVIVARGVHPEGTLNPLAGSRQCLDGERAFRAAIPGAVTDDRDSSGDLNNRGFFNKLSELNWRTSHLRLLLPDPSRDAHRFVTGINVNPVTVFTAQPSTAVGPNWLTA